MKKSGRIGRSGLSIIELTLYVSVAATAGIMISRMMKQTPRLTATMNTMIFQQGAYNQTNLPVADVLSAIAVSIRWDDINPSQPACNDPPIKPCYDRVNGPNLMPWFQIHEPDSSMPSWVCYRYDAATQTVLRSFVPNSQPSDTPCMPVTTDHAVTTTVARHILAPTPERPLFAKDTAASNMVIFTLKLKQSGGSATADPLIVQRRVFVQS